MFSFCTISLKICELKLASDLCLWIFFIGRLGDRLSLKIDLVRHPRGAWLGLEGECQVFAVQTCCTDSTEKQVLRNGLLLAEGVCP